MLLERRTVNIFIVDFVIMFIFFLWYINLQTFSSQDGVILQGFPFAYSKMGGDCINQELGIRVPCENYFSAPMLVADMALLLVIGFVLIYLAVYIFEKIRKKDEYENAYEENEEEFEE